MRESVTATTYVASLLLFQPSRLPADYDRTEEAPIDLIDAAHRSGKVLWFPAFPSDRAGLGVAGTPLRMDVYLDSPVDPAVEAHRSPVVACDDFGVTAGPLYFSGAEFAYRDDATQLTSVENSGAIVPIPAGQWKVSIDRVVGHHHSIDRNFRHRSGLLDTLLYRASSWAIAAALILTLVALVTCFVFPLDRWLFTSLPAMVILVVAATVLRVSPGCRRARTVLAEEAERFPDFVAVFERSSGQRLSSNPGVSSQP